MAQGLGHRDSSGKVKFAKIDLNHVSSPDDDEQHDTDPGRPTSGDADLLRQLAETALAKLMAFEVEDLVGATKGQHVPTERVTDRNGYRERPLHTRLGTLELRIPKLRQGTYFPSFLEPRRLSERALTAVIQEAWIGGMSTCKLV